MLNPGTYLQDRYEILGRIGSGGMSVVYKAKCHTLNRLVAIKVLKEEFASDENFVSKFKMEAQAAARLSHPNIVNVYDVVDEGDLHYIVMELIEGITGGIYRSMSIDQNLNIFMNTPTRLVPIDQVSSGTMDQIYLAVRLAAAKLVISDRGTMPLIFDDSFVLYDDDRLKTALKWLAGAWDSQCIIFTCHQREEAILKSEGIEHHLIQI